MNLTLDEQLNKYKMTEVTEVWRPIVIDNQTLEYQISNQGNVKKGTKLAPLNVKEGQDIKYKFYLKDGKGKTKMVHVLVATEFLPNPNNYTCVNHKNGNIHDNRVENLEWVSNSTIVKKAYEQQTRVTTGIPIDQYSEDGNTFIKRFDSIRHAAEELDIPEKNFHHVLNGTNKTTGGFHFKYVVVEKVKPQGFEPIVNHPDYMINRQGQVFNVKQQVLMEPKVNNTFLFVYIERKRAFLHQLVAAQFLDNPKNLTRVVHVDGDKTNNSVENLRWY